MDLFLRLVRRRALWVGAFIDRPKRRVYILPLPCMGIVVEWGTND